MSRAPNAAARRPRRRAAKPVPAVLAALAALVVAMVLAGAGCAPRDAPAALRLPLSSDISGLDFPRASDMSTRKVRELISDPLVAFDQQMEAVPAAAASWSWSPDRTRLTFVLREGARWHDGRPVTAADVVHTWRVETDPALGDPGRAAGFNLVEDVVALDESTVEVRYARPFSAALSAWAAAPLVPAHLPPGAEPPVGCGRYVFERWDSGERVVLRPDPNHPATGPWSEPLVLDVIKDPTTQLAALRSGRLDAVSLLPATWRELQSDAEFVARFEVHEYRALYYWFIAWRGDGSNPFFSDPRVRRAMTLAIDRHAYHERLGGRDLTAVTSFHPASWAYHDGLRPWPFDPARARSLLDEAGWRDADGDGVRERDGVDFDFPLLFLANRVETEKIAAYAQDALREVGVRMTLEPVEWAVLLDRLGERSFAAVMSGMWLDPDPDAYDLWHSSQADDGMNYSGLRDAQIDAWIEAARGTFDRGERTHLYHLVQERLHELEPLTVFFYPTSRLAVSRSISGVAVGPVGPLRGRPGPEAWRRSP